MRGWLGRHDLGLLTLVAALIAATHLFGEKIQVGGGLGWDGVLYGRIAMDFVGMVLQKGYVTFIAAGYESIVFQRLGPSLLIHALLRPFYDPITTPTVIMAFIAGNIIATTVTCALVLSTLRRLGVGPVGRWTAAAGLLLNFCILKWLSYYPVLTDAYGLLLGAWMLHAYVARRPWQILVAMVLAAFTWPADFYFGVALLLFGGPVAAPSRLVWLDYPRLSWALAGLAAVGYGAIAWYLMQPLEYARVPFNVQPALFWLAPVSVLIGAAWVLFGVKWLLDGSIATLAQATLTIPRRLTPYLTLAAIVAIRQVHQWLAPGASSVEVGVYEHMIQSGAFRPGMFLLGHVVFFGPAIVLVVLYWRQMGAVAGRLGPGLVVGLGAILALGLGSESRRLINALPVLAVLLGVVADADGWSWKHVAGFAILSALTSKVWLEIGVFYDATSVPPRLFMNLGPWMELDAYLLQGAIALAVAAILTVIYPRRHPARTGTVARRPDPVPYAPH